MMIIELSFPFFKYFLFYKNSFFRKCFYWRKMHLFLISHGLQGTTSSMMFLVETFEKFKDTKVLNSSINCDGSWFETGPFKNWYLTSDGIDGGGERLIKELKIYLQNNKKDKFDKISFVGSSLGGNL